MTTRGGNEFETKDVLKTASASHVFFNVGRLAESGFKQIERLPISLRVLLENVLRNQDGYRFTADHVRSLIEWQPNAEPSVEIPFMPARVILQDFTGVPALVDLAALRSAIARMGGDPKRINPQVPVDLVIDHSVQVDFFGSETALRLNVDLEYQRNQERYQFLRWGQQAFDHLRVIPPNTGIVHQVNLEYLAKVAIETQAGSKDSLVYPDTVVGTDSHTTMINGLGVVGWGVGGIEAEAVMLGQPIYMLIPQVVGFRLSGALPAGTTATDLVLVITEILRKKGVVGKFVEFYGEGLSSMALADRATIANMAPEYGATMGFFPVDDQTLQYLHRTGRSSALIETVKAYYQAQGLYRTDDMPDPVYSDTLELDLGTVVPSLAGPKRPQDRVPLDAMKSSFRDALTTPTKQRGFELKESDLSRQGTVQMNGHSTTLGHGAVVIAAITSCTNTSNPSVMIGAGLVAQKAVQRGLCVPKYVKTSLAPGSRVVSDYLTTLGLTRYLDQLGFQTVGYGCTTCIGNSGPLPQPIADAIQSANLVACAVLSGNRNFEGRINPLTRANYLASPPLVVAYAIAGTVDIDLNKEPLGTDTNGHSVYLKDIWPTNEEIMDAIERCVTPEMFKKQYADVLMGNEQWSKLRFPSGDAYDWDPESTYIQEPPFFIDLSTTPPGIQPIQGARVLALFGDSVTTDHISPAGSIPQDGPAGEYLREHGVAVKDFNSFGSRRGNDRVMTRGTFANIRIRNLLVPDSEGGVTLHWPTQAQLSIFEAAKKYQDENIPLIVIAGDDYGMGSSRDWAAKGTRLLGVGAVLAKSYERIHRSNLVGMGVLPLQFKPGQDAHSLKLSGKETFDILGLNDQLEPQQTITVRADDQSGSDPKILQMIVRIDTPVEMDYYRHGGILPMVLRNMLER